MKTFVFPVFGSKCLELRCTGDEVCIYGNREGMKRLSDLCLRLADTTAEHGTEHVHLEDYDVLTPASLRGTIAIFGDQSGDTE